MNLFFDMDYTIIEIDNGTLRPGVRDLFDRLRSDGHTLYIWSGIGERSEEVKMLGLYELVAGVFRKPWEKYEQMVVEMLTTSEIPVRPDLVIDDTAAIVRELGGVIVQQYGAMSSREDREMERVYRVISEYVTVGHSVDGRFIPPVTTFAKTAI